MSIVRVGHEATPLPGAGNRPGSAWCERPGGPVPRSAAVGGSLEAERALEPEGDRMTAASIYGSPQKLLRGGKSARRTRFPWGETGVLGEATDMCSRGAWRGMGPGTCARVAEITSGRTISQQGLVATCKDPAPKGRPEAGGGFWSGAWVRMSDEGGVTPSEATREVVPTWGNTLGGQRSPGHSVAKDRRHGRGMAGSPVQPSPARREDMAGSPVQPPPVSPLLGRSVPEPGGRQTAGLRGVCVPALEPPLPWAGLLTGKWRAEPRSEPDSGNPTVRDRRGALRTVPLVAGLPPVTMVRALNFYPDNRTYGLKGGWGNEPAPRVPRP
jgi:hypothetical protein